MSLESTFSPEPPLLYTMGGGMRLGEGAPGVSRPGHHKAPCVSFPWIQAPETQGQLPFIAIL